MSVTCYVLGLALVVAAYKFGHLRGQRVAYRETISLMNIANRQQAKEPE